MLSTPRGNKEASGYKSFSKDKLNEFTEVQTWLKTIAPQSAVVYLGAIQRFCNWCGKDPHELILQRDHELKNDDPNNRTCIRDILLDFRHHLEHKGLSPKNYCQFGWCASWFFHLGSR